MTYLIRSALALGLVLGPAIALAQIPQGAKNLPMEARNPVGDVVPGVGPTPGMVLQLDPPAALCASSAARASDGLVAPSDAIVTCNEAIASGVVPKLDLAATLVNRGVLLLTMKRVVEAK